MSAPEIPEAEIGILADWWAEQGEKAMAYARSVYALRGRLIQAVTEGGVEGLGRLRVKAKGWKYRPDAAAEFPTLVRRATVTATYVIPAHAEMAMELLAEQTPDAVLTFDVSLDGRAANSAILNGTGGERLLELREPTGFDLEVKP